VNVDNIVRQSTASGKTWKAYAESLPSQAYIGSDVYPYAQRHNPFAYFTAASTARDMTEFF
jgi:acid phosphatase